MCQEAADKQLEAEIDKTKAAYDKKIETIKDRMSREERELRQDETELSQRRLEELGTHAETVLSLFSGRRRKITTSLSKRRMTSNAKADVEESEETIEEYKHEIEDLGKEREEKLAAIRAKWNESATATTEMAVTPYKKDILVEFFGIAWFPYHVIDRDGRTMELPAYGKGE